MKNTFVNLKILSKKTLSKLSKWLDDSPIVNSEPEYRNLTEEEVLKEAEKLKKLQGDNIELYIIKKDFKDKYNFLDKNVKIVLKHYIGDDMLMPVINNINLSNPFEFKKYCEKINYNLTTLKALLNNSINKMENYRCNPLLVYYGMTADIAKTQLPFESTIINSDYKQIETVINQANYQDKQEIDILLNTMGGDVSTTVKILQLLRKKFKKINLIVPYSAQSAGTLMACASNEIIVSDSPVFSQTAPLLYGENTYTIKTNYLLMHILGYIFNHNGYRDKFGLSAKKKAIEAEESMKNILDYFLTNHTFKGKKSKVKNIIQRLTDFELFYSHELCIPSDELKDMGLNITYMEGHFKELIYEQANIIEEIMKTGNISKIICSGGNFYFNEIVELANNKEEL